MNRTTALTMVVALVVALAVMPPGAASAFTGVQDGDEDVEVDDEVQPGEHLNGVVGVQQAEIDGEVTERAYGVKIAQAQTDEAKADVVNETLEDVEDRIDDLEDRLEELEEARENGEITEGQYNAEVTKVVAEKRTAERLAEGVGATVAEHNLEELGVDVEAIGELRERAGELGGEEVAEIAQSIAGEKVGQSIASEKVGQSIASEKVGQSIAEDREPGAPIEMPGQDRDDGDRSETPDEGDDHSETPDEGGEDTDERPSEE